MTIKYFTIYGERCSGTNFLMQSITENFNIEYTTKYCWKHFFGHYKFENNEEEDETLFIGIIREPISWIDSFFKKKHHDDLYLLLLAFISEWCSNGKYAFISWLL